jgi:hypothetical protein
VEDGAEVSAYFDAMEWRHFEPAMKLFALENVYRLRIPYHDVRVTAGSYCTLARMKFEDLCWSRCEDLGQPRQGNLPLQPLGKDERKPNLYSREAVRERPEVTRRLWRDVRCLHVVRPDGVDRAVEDAFPQSFDVGTGA